MAATEYLRVTDLHAFYGKSHILHGVSLVVGKGEVVGLLGRNGVGKSTTLKTIMGLVGARQGSITLEGVEFDTSADATTFSWPQTAETERCPLWLAPSDTPMPASRFRLVSVENNTPIALWLRTDAPGADDVIAMGLAFGDDPCTPLPASQYGAWLSADGDRLTVRRLDAFDGSPVLDIKPYVRYADAFPPAP